MMPLRFALVVLLLLAPWTDAQVPPLLLRSVNVGGTLRYYRVYVPTGLTFPAPMVIGLHGGGGNAQSFANYRFDLTADANGFLLVYPEGTNALGPPPFALETWNAGTCCGSAATNGVDDVGFIDALIDAVEAEWSVDPNRIFATGFSNGGMMTYRLGVELAHRLAAIAPVGAALQVTTVPMRPIPLIGVHGLLDTNVPVGGGLGSGVSNTPFTSQADSLAPFLSVNQAGSLPSSPTQVIGEAELYVANAATTGADVHYWLLRDQGHSWPGLVSPLNPNGPVNMDIEVNQIIWDFFAAHPRDRRVTQIVPGCAPSFLPTPTLSATSPILGRPVFVSGMDAPGVPGFLVMSAPTSSPTTVLGCDVGVDPFDFLPIAVLPPTAQWSRAFFVPLDGALHQARARLQAAWFPGGQLITSPALELTLAW